MREKITSVLLWLALFLLPWQARWIIETVSIGEGVSEYGQFSVYVVQGLILFAAVLRGRPRYPSALRFVMQAGYFFLAAVFFSLGVTSFFSIGLAQSLHVVFAFALLSLLCDERTNLKHAAMAFVGGMLMPAALGWWQVITGSSPESAWLGLAAKDALQQGTAVVETASGRLLRAYGSFPHPNIFGGFLAVSLVMLGWLVRYIHSRRTLVFSLFPVIFLSATLIMSFSRGAWLGICLGFLTLIGLMVFRRRVPPSRAVIPIMLGLISVLATLTVFHQHVFSRIGLEGRVEQISVRERSSQYSRFDDLFYTAPILGVGPGAYPFVLAQMDSGGEAWAYQPIHNAFLLILGELGIIGLGALIYLLLRVDQVSSRSAKTAGGMFGLSLGIVLIVIGLFDHYLWSLWPGLALGALGIGFIVRWAQPETGDR